MFFFFVCFFYSIYIRSSLASQQCLNKTRSFSNNFLIIYIEPINILLNVRKHTLWHVCQVKIQISLHICTVWSEFSMDTFWKAMDAKFFHKDNEDWSDCAEIKADLSLRWAYVSWYAFSCRSSYVSICDCIFKHIFFLPQTIPINTLSLQYSNTLNFKLIKFTISVTQLWQCKVSLDNEDPDQTTVNVIKLWTPEVLRKLHRQTV